MVDGICDAGRPHFRSARFLLTPYITFGFETFEKICIPIGLRVATTGKFEKPKIYQSEYKKKYLQYNRRIGFTNTLTHSLTYQNSKVLPEVVETCDFAN